ncbi:MAG: hypothetical protein AAFZ07_10390 [Actinomycetota bacterium]
MTDVGPPRYGTIDTDYAARLATTAPEDDGPVWMVNLMRYREVADYADGRESTLSGREADDLYTPLESLAGVGAEIAFVADVQDQFLNDSPPWDRVAVVRYPTRRAFIEMQSRPDFQRQHVHKDAGMAETFVIGCQPMPKPDAGLEHVDWAGVPHPPTDEDGPVVVVHVVRFEEAVAAGTSPEDMDAYSTAAAQVALPHGARVDGWFGVEGTIVGDGRTWDQVRFNAFPSRAAFLAVVADPARLEAQRAHRETAIADTYTLVTRPMINRLAESVD